MWNCENGHMDVAKRIFSLGGVNIHADDEYAFYWSRINGHMEIAKWLVSLGANIPTIWLAIMTFAHESIH